MKLSTVIFIGLLVCVVKDVHAANRKHLAKQLRRMENDMKALKTWKGNIEPKIDSIHAGGEHGPLERRLSLIENDMNAWKGNVVDIERNMFDKFEGLESSLKEKVTGTFVPSLIKRLLKQSIADILDEDYVGNIISARVIDEVDSMKVNIQNTKTRLKAITQQLRRVERDRNTYRDDLGKVLKELTVTRRDIRALEQNVKQLNTSCVMRTETVPGSTTAPTDPSLSTTVPPVTSQDPDQHASTDPNQHPSLSTTVPPVTTPDPDQHATPSAATGEDLYDASERGDLETVRRIVAAGRVDVNVRGPGSHTPVMEAAVEGHRDVVEFLVGEGADPSLVDRYGNNILHLACEGGDLETVKLILSLNVVDINSRGMWSRTPVMEAAYNGHRDVVEFLVGEGADTSLVDKDGNNVLHYACREGDLEMVKLILSLDVVDINARNGYGRTAAYWARRKGHQRVLDLLVSRGGH